MVERVLQPHRPVLEDKPLTWEPRSLEAPRQLFVDELDEVRPEDRVAMARPRRLELRQHEPTQYPPPFVSRACEVPWPPHYFEQPSPIGVVPVQLRDAPLWESFSRAVSAAPARV